LIIRRSALGCTQISPENSRPRVGQSKPSHQAWARGSRRIAANARGSGRCPATGRPHGRCRHAVSGFADV